MKCCTKCHTLKPLTDYGKMSSQPSGLHYTCKLCLKEYYDKPENKAKKKEYSKEYTNNPENKVKAKEYYGKEENKAKALAYKKIYNTLSGVRAKRYHIKARRRATYTYPNEDVGIRALYVQAKELETV